jgi:hypothetical protein
MRSRRYVYTNLGEGSGRQKIKYRKCEQSSPTSLLPPVSKIKANNNGYGKKGNDIHTNTSKICHNETSSIAVSAPIPSSPGVSPPGSTELMGCPLERVTSAPVDFPRLLKCIEPTFPGTTASLVNALRLATRRMMRNGAMT